MGPLLLQGSTTQERRPAPSLPSLYLSLVLLISEEAKGKTALVDKLLKAEATSGESSLIKRTVSAEALTTCSSL